MRLSYFHSPDRVPGEGMGDAAVVIDVLRATTTMAWALHNGAEAVQAFADLGSLDAAAESWPAERRLRAGERGGKKLEGFDLGNSPLAVTPEVVSGRRIFMSTTNGTRALDRVQAAPLLFTCALANRSAVAARLLSEQPKSIWVVGSGWEGAYSLEDSLAAGALIDALLRPDAGHDLDLVQLAGNDEAAAAHALWLQWRNQPEQALRLASHGQRLQRLGDHDADLACCASIDTLTVVPQQCEPGVLQSS
ncbi:MAG: 2-phosphosulfolactate phosphatase [Synechococcus sp. TMED19]|nr:MAG: 2-phosphosulfolactate phosphatase [Synechococcus sp. TMED19]